MSEIGKYTVIEGSDGVGKTTQLELLKRKLDEQGIDAVFTREPGGNTKLGTEVRRLLLSPEIPIKSHVAEIALFTADRAEVWAEIIEPALNAGKLVVSDRNWFSTLAYQTASDPEIEERIVAVTKALLPERYVTPDLAIVLTLSEEERKRRRDKREEGAIADSFEVRDEEYFKKVYDMYEWIPRRMGAVAISADPQPDEVFSVVWKEFETLLKS